MGERLLARLTVTFQGAPIGTLNLYEVDREQPIEPLLPPELRSKLDRTPTLRAGQFSALPAFQSVTSPLFRISDAMRTAEEAWRQTLAEPPSPAARQALNAVWDQLMALERVLHETSAVIEHELELRDELDQLVPGSHFTLGLDPPAVGAFFDDVPADVLARLRNRRAIGSGDEPPAA
jgi:hypothetical protein